MLDLRKYFKRLLLKHGHAVYLVQFDRRIKCICYREKEQEGDPNCKICFGQGHPAKVFRYLTRSRLLDATTHSTRLEPPGEASPHGYNFYFQHFVHPAKGDFVLEPASNEAGKLIGLKNVYVISHSEPEICNREQIEYYKVYARAQPSLRSQAWNALIWHLDPESRNSGR
jgi:hypothetical protein